LLLTTSGCEPTITNMSLDLYKMYLAMKLFSENTYITFMSMH
jgi:hypothetical protein